MNSNARNLSFGFSDQIRHEVAYWSTEDGQTPEIYILKQTVIAKSKCTNQPVHKRS